MLSRAEAIRIVDSLRKGTPPPPEHVLLLNVGREKEIDYFERKLSEVAEYGSSDVKFISAQIGAGKTHFLNILSKLALDRNFVVSKVDLDTRSTRFDHFEEVYSKLIDGIATHAASHDGLTTILEEWAQSRRQAEESDIYGELRGIDGLPIELRAALFAFWRLVSTGSSEAYMGLDDLRTWLKGEKLSAASKKRIGVTSPIGRTNASTMLRGLIGFFTSVGYSGLVVLLDEAEAITSLTRIQDRDAANENIRSIIDNADRTRGFYFVFATTPSFLDPGSAKGAATYQALYRRIRDPLAGAGSSMERTIIELPALTADQYRALARHVREIVEASKGDLASPLAEEQIDRLAQYAHDRASEQLSTLVRATVVVVSESIEQPDFDFESTYLFEVEEQLQSYQDSLME